MMFNFLRYKRNFKISMPCDRLTNLLESLVNKTFANSFSFIGGLVRYKFKVKDSETGFFTIYPVGRIGGLQGYISSEGNMSLLRLQMAPQPWFYLLFILGVSCLIGQVAWEFKAPLVILFGIFMSAIILVNLWTLRCVAKALDDILISEEFNAVAELNNI